MADSKFTRPMSLLTRLLELRRNLTESSTEFVSKKDLSDFMEVLLLYYSELEERQKEDKIKIFEETR